MDTVHLIETVENLVKVALAYTFARVGHMEDEVAALFRVSDGYGTVVGRMFECIGKQVEEHTLYLLGVEGHGEGGCRVSVLPA